MNCKLCEKEIKNYSSEFNQLKIDGDHKIEVCQDCVEKFQKWQQQIITQLFPTKAMKKLQQKTPKATNFN
jgi:ribosome-binding protein aMBF1 (putative translation factor)